ncbi:MAG: glycosyltransferase family 29 protein [Xanthobacteraceae bacterium]
MTATAPFTELLALDLSQPIAVVGNARLRCRFGALIDAHKTVIRFNDFQILGHEARCGSRVTHWCTFGDTTNNAPLPKCHRVGLTPFSPFTRLAPESMDIKPHFRNRMVFAAKSRRRELFPRPSTGFALLLLLEELGCPADVFGFDGFRTGHYYDPGHVHDPVHSAGEFDYLLNSDLFRVFLNSYQPLALAPRRSGLVTRAAAARRPGSVSGRPR